MMTKTIAYPDEFFNDQLLEEHFAKLSLQKDDFAQNILNVSLFHMDDYFGSLNKAINNSAWTSRGQGVLIANAFNHLARNEIGIITFYILFDISYILYIYCYFVQSLIDFIHYINEEIFTTVILLHNKNIFRRIERQFYVLYKTAFLIISYYSRTISQPLDYISTFPLFLL